MTKTKLLFLLRKNNTSSGMVVYEGNVKSGLSNSVKLTKEVLEAAYQHVEIIIEVCLDSNEIDKFVTLHEPNLCITEAIWVPPYKFEQLVKKHPDVRFINRIHSELPFLTHDGVAIGWIKEYEKLKHVWNGFNSKETFDDFTRLLDNDQVYLPNLYPISKPKVNLIDEAQYNITKESALRFSRKYFGQPLNVGCFGAIRPMKNQLLQAAAAIQAADDLSMTLNFHINADRVEHGGAPVLKNLRALFEGTDHELHEHGWLNREDFLTLCSKMDLGMQLSFSETFNIVTADMISQGVPVVVSPSISWMPKNATVDPEVTEGARRKIKEMVLFKRYFASKAKEALWQYNIEALKAWRIII